MKRNNMRGVVDLLLLGAIISVSSFFGVLATQDKDGAEAQKAPTEIVQPAAVAKPEDKQQ